MKISSGWATHFRLGLRSVTAPETAIAVSILLFGVPAMGQFHDDGLVKSDLPALSSPADSTSIPAALPYTSVATPTERAPGQMLYRWSVAAVLAANAADIASSWQRPEANPFLTNPGAKFDLGSVLLKSGFVGASLLIEYWALHHNQRLYKAFAWLNYGVAGSLGWVVEHNMSLH